MRIKKIILLIDQNEERRSIRSFLLTNKGFKVVTEPPEQADLVVGCWPCGEEVVRLAKYFHVPSLILVDKLNSTKPFGMGADQVLSGENTAPWCITEAVKAMSARKRGPKPAVLTLSDGRLKVVA